MLEVEITLRGWRCRCELKRSELLSKLSVALERGLKFKSSTRESKQSKLAGVRKEKVTSLVTTAGEGSRESHTCPARLSFFFF